VLPDVIKYYDILSSSKEVPALQYLSHLSDQNMTELANASLEADLQYGRTTRGIHRDDLELLLDMRAVKRFASQGQIKSLLIALHLAQAEYLRRSIGITPVLLLDDIFDRLDEGRAQSLISLLSTENAGQVFISDASPARVQRLLGYSDRHAQVLEIHKGSLSSKPVTDGEEENGNLWPHDDAEE
jgi:DNA replication and repair protein RecF